MKRMIKALSLLLTLTMLAACGTEPTGIMATTEWEYEVSGTQLIGTCQGEQTIVFQGDKNGGYLQAVASPNKLYILWDDVLYSMDADGSNQYKVDTRCYNPGEVSGFISDATVEHTLGYYDGYVYYIEYGTTSKLKRFPVGGKSAEVLAKDSASVFTISADGILTTYVGSVGQYSKSLELNLAELQ